MRERELVIKYCNNLGLDTVGFTRCRIFEELKPFLEERKHLNLQNEFEEDDINKRINPFIYMPKGKTIISIAFPYLFSSFKQENIGFSKYTMGIDYHKVVEGYLTNICKYIESLGGKALHFVDNNFLPERYIAYLSKIGFIGKNNMLITKKYGSFVFLGEIITDMDLLNSQEKENSYEGLMKGVVKHKECGECSICISECPTKAINLNKKNPNICLSYITQKKNIDDKWFKLIGERMFGCDSCQDRCPYNQDIAYSKIEEFNPKEHMQKTDLEEIMNMNNKVFKDKYANTSCGWRGKNVLIRNALIASSNLGKDIAINDIKSPYVKDYYDRLLKHKEL